MLIGSPGSGCWLATLRWDAGWRARRRNTSLDRDDLASGETVWYARTEVIRHTNLDLVASNFFIIYICIYFFRNLICIHALSISTIWTDILRIQTPISTMPMNKFQTLVLIISSTLMMHSFMSHSMKYESIRQHIHGGNLQHIWQSKRH